MILWDTTVTASKHTTSWQVLTLKMLIMQTWKNIGENHENFQNFSNEKIKLKF